jgi:hypothetical protein
MFGWDYDSDNPDGPQQCQGYAHTRGRRCQVMLDSGSGDYCHQHNDQDNWQNHYKTCFVCEDQVPLDFLEGYDDQCCDNENCWLCGHCEGALNISCSCECRPRCEIYKEHYECDELKSCARCSCQLCPNCPNLCVDCGECRSCQEYNQLESESARKYFKKKKKRCYECALKRHARKQKNLKNTKKRKRNQNQIDKDAENEITNTTSKRIHKRQKN